jgi:type I restriction enzyme S subunit
VVDCPHATPKWTESGVVVLRNQNIKSGRLDLSAPSFTNEEHYRSRVKRAAPQGGDIVITREAPMGDVCQIPRGLRCCLGQRQVLLRPDPERVDARFLLFALQSPYIQHQIGWNEGTGSTVSNLRIPVLEALKIPTPPMAQQVEIAATLGAIDDRIALLRETNATLEAIAQALFKSWFVDFDPVRAKQQGLAPAGIDETTATLFPDTFEESAFGPMPSGWRINAISELVEGVYDGPHATPPEAEDGPVFLGIKNLTGTGLDLGDIRHIAEGDWLQWTRRVTPRAGDIVFSYEATLGFFALIPPGLRCCLGRRLALIRPTASKGCPHFLFHQFTAAPFQRLLEKHTIQGATVNRIAFKHFPSYPVLNPSDALKVAFDDRVAPLWARIHENHAQAQTLTTLRDTLLPRLISGQLRLPEAEALAADAHTA